MHPTIMPMDRSRSPLPHMLCLVPDCQSEVVRVFVWKGSAVGTTEADSLKRAFGLCSHHVRRAILYLRDDKVRELVFPQEP